MAITVPADDRPGLERLCRYVLRPPVAQDRLHVTPDGQILVTLKAEWVDGTTHLLFEPVELLEMRLAGTAGGDPRGIRLTPSLRGASAVGGAR